MACDRRRCSALRKNKKRQPCCFRCVSNGNEDQMLPIQIAEGSKQEMFDFITGWYWFDRVERVEVFQQGLDEDIERLASWWMQRKEILRFEDSFFILFAWDGQGA